MRAAPKWRREARVTGWTARALVLLGLWGTSASGAETAWAPWEPSADEERSVEIGRTASAVSTTPGLAAMAAIRFYQRFLSRPYNAAFNPAGCPFSPSCSDYGHEAIQSFGLLRGLPMTGDRLLRCHAFASSGGYDLVTSQGRSRLSDPAAWLGQTPATPRSPIATTPALPPPASHLDRGADTMAVPTTFAFGLHLFRSGDYYRAITEFKRSAFFGSDTTSAVHSNYMVGLSEYAAGRYGEALVTFDRLLRPPSTGRLREAGRFYQGRCWDLLGEHAAAQVIFGRGDFEDPQLRDRAAFAVGWSQLTARDWAGAAASMRRYADVFPDGPYHGLAGRVASDLSRRPPFGLKRVSLGLVCSIIPGGGQLYAGRVADAINTLLLVGAPTAIAVRGSRQGSSSAETLGTLFALGFYLSNLYGGANAVTAHNTQRIESVMQSYRSELRSSGFDDYILP